MSHTGSQNNCDRESRIINIENLDTSNYNINQKNDFE